MLWQICVRETSLTGIFLYVLPGSLHYISSLVSFCLCLQRRTFQGIVWDLSLFDPIFCCRMQKKCTEHRKIVTATELPTPLLGERFTECNRGGREGAMGCKSHVKAEAKVSGWDNGVAPDRGIRRTSNTKAKTLGSLTTHHLTLGCAVNCVCVSNSISI